MAPGLGRNEVKKTEDRTNEHSTRGQTGEDNRSKVSSNGPKGFDDI